MKLSVSAYRAHASAHKKILSSSYQTHYGSTAPSQSSSHTSSGLFSMEPIDPQKLISSTTCTSLLASSTTTTAINSNDPRSPTETVVSAAISSMGTSREDEEDSSNQNSSDCKSPGNRSFSQKAVKIKEKKIQ
ncbi:CLUMA_CG012214, isoform A [Clunio marinus]|uniref:CLUMA_CG012214, isoform A n=1 Tax=Clunio marinus TaxID=568069 RepID=A0A1J1IFE9_9DIPT|nr:CLUMA_CG012214, isoform A [Clunio marinus]